MTTGYTTVNIDIKRVIGTGEAGTIKFYSYAPITLTNGDVIPPNPQALFGGTVTLSSTGTGSVELAPTDNTAGLGYGTRYVVKYTGVADTTERLLGSILVTTSTTALDLATLLAADVSAPSPVTPTGITSFYTATSIAIMQAMTGLQNGDRVFVDDQAVYRAQVPPVTTASGNVAITSTDGLTRFILDESGATYRTTVNVTAYGAVGNGIADDTSAVQAAITAAGAGGVVVFPPGKTYLITSGLTTPDSVTLEGGGFFLGAGASPPAQITFAVTGATIGITAGVNITLRNILLRGPGSGVGTCTGVSVSSHVRMQNVQFYGWAKGVNLTTSYYSQFTGCEWNGCAIGVVVTSAYNLNFYGPKFVNCPTAIDLDSAVKPINIFGGSVENYTSAEAFKDYVGSQWNINGVYFETNSTNAVGCSLGAGSSMTLTGCYISLSEVFRFINLSGLTNVTFVAYGNRFGCSSSSVTPTAYLMPAGGDVRIFNDDWSDVSITATYMSGNYNAGGMPSNWDVQSPDDATSQWDTGVHLHGRSIAFAKRTAAPSTPINGAIYLADNSSWDPLLQAGTSPYFVMYDGTGYKFIGSPGIQATTAPASGTWRTGDIVWNSAPTTGSAMGWRCVSGGTPGTWETLSYLNWTAAATIGVSTSGLPLFLFRDTNAGDSTNLVEQRIGNSGNSQGAMALRYTNAAASASPSCALYFFPRNNANSSNFQAASLVMTKTAAADTATVDLTGSNNARIYMTAAGNLALCNGTTASARVHLPAGTATASTAPLKFTAGTLLTTAEAWAMEPDATYMYMTFADAVRRRMVTSLVGSATYDPPSLAAAGTTTTTVTVTGAALGDYATCSFSLSSAGIMMTAYVSAANTVTVVLFNPTAGAIDLASGTLRCMVVPQ